MDYWQGRCPLTGITDPALLRASHIVPWAECDSDAERLNVHNGLLLSALWDAAFDRALVTFDDEGEPLFSPKLSERGARRTALEVSDYTDHPTSPAAHAASAALEGTTMTSHRRGTQRRVLRRTKTRARDFGVPSPARRRMPPEATAKRANAERPRPTCGRGLGADHSALVLRLRDQISE